MRQSDILYRDRLWKCSVYHLSVNGSDLNLIESGLFREADGIWRPIPLSPYCPECDKKGEKNEMEMTDAPD